MTLHFMTPLLLDRIGITVVIGDKDAYYKLQAKFYSMQKMQGQLLPQGKIKVNKKEYEMRLDYYASFNKPDRRKIADITIGTYILNGVIKRYFKLTLYPSQFKAGDFDRFKEILETELPDFRYEKLYYTGRVTYLELAVDSLTHKNHTFLPLRLYCSKSWIYPRKDGTRGTLYLGHKTSNMRTRFYNKRRKFLDAGKPVPYVQYPAQTRIEAVMRQLHHTPATLPQMENPFRHILVIDLYKAESASNDPIWLELISMSKVTGLPKALSQFPQHRKNHMKALKKLQVSWFHPEKIWSDLPNAVAIIAP